MFGSGDLCENFEFTLVLFGQIQNFKKCTWTIYRKSHSQTCDYKNLFREPSEASETAAKYKKRGKYWPNHHVSAHT